MTIFVICVGSSLLSKATNVTLISMLPQSYRHYLIHSIRAVVTSNRYREVLLYLIIYQSICSVNNEINVIS